MPKRPNGSGGMYNMRLKPDGQMIRADWHVPTFL